MWGAACAVPARLRGLDLERLPTRSKIIALTFDAGAGAEGLPSILDTLETTASPGTFFLKGDFVSSHPARAKAIAKRHVVGNHTQHHPYLTGLPAADVAAEVDTAERTIKRITGQNPRRFFRFPYGDRDARTIRIVNDLCYVSFRWSVDSLGWKGTSGGMSVEKVADRVTRAAKSGGIVLMHVGANPDDHTTRDAAALPRIIDRLRARGYRLVARASSLTRRRSPDCRNRRRPN